MPRQPRFRAEFEARQMPDWPAGFSSLAPGFQVFPVFLAELPPTRETLPLRLMGSRSLRRAALRELLAIPEGDPDALFLQDLAATLRLLVDRDNNVPQADRSILMSELTLEWNRIKDEEFRRGVEKGEQMLRQMLVEFCDVLAIPLTSERHAHIAGLSMGELSDLWAYIKQHRAWPAP